MVSTVVAGRIVIMNYNDFANWLENNGINQFFDSGVTVDTKQNIKRILLTLDVNTSLLMYASMNNYDTIIVHHAVGKHYYQAHKELYRRARFLFDKGIISPNDYNTSKECQHSCETIWSANKITVCSLAEQLQVRLISYHSAADIIVSNKIVLFSKNTSNRDVLLSNIADFLNAPYFLHKYGIALHIYGPKEGFFKLAYCDIAYALPPSDKIIKQTIDYGYDFLIVTAISQNSIEYAEEKGVTIICINHLQIDICAMTILSDMISSSFPTINIQRLW